MAILRAPGSPGLVSQPQVAADLLEQAALKSSAKNRAHDSERGVILVFQQTSQMADADARLVDVVLLDQKHAARGLFRHLWERRDGRLLGVPVRESLLDLAFMSAAEKSP